MLRLTILVAVLVAAGALHAQTAVNISGSVSDSESRLYLLEVDHGTAPVAVTMVLDFSTTSDLGLSISVHDLDLYTEIGPPAGTVDWMFGAGSLQVVYTTSARSGVRDYIVEVRTKDIGGSALYDASIAVSSGTAAITDTTTMADGFTGVQAVFGRAIQYYRTIEYPGVYWFDFIMQGDSFVGGSAIVVSLRALSVVRARLLDMSASTPVAIAEWQGDPDSISDRSYLTIPVDVVERRYRLEFNMLSDTGYAWCYIVTRPEIRVLSATDSIASAPSGGGGGGDGCVTGAAGHQGIAALLPALAMARRRRRS